MFQVLLLCQIVFQHRTNSFFLERDQAFVIVYVVDSITCIVPVYILFSACFFLLENVFLSLFQTLISSLSQSLFSQPTSIFFFFLPYVVCWLWHFLFQQQLNSINNTLTTSNNFQSGDYSKMWLWPSISHMVRDESGYF